jgi:hypothetical protein
VNVRDVWDRISVGRRLYSPFESIPREVFLKHLAERKMDNRVLTLELDGDAKTHSPVTWDTWWTKQRVFINTTVENRSLHDVLMTQSTQQIFFIRKCARLPFLERSASITNQFPWLTPSTGQWDQFMQGTIINPIIDPAMGRTQ